MKKPVNPPDEIHRQEILDGLEVLDTPFEAVYDDLCRVASEICQTPVATITLIDRDRQWFKARVGTTTREGAREVSFCGHAINGHEVLNVPDLRADERFADNPLVTGESQFQFYAGAPLVVASGEVLGTICVLDHRPRTLSATQLDTLKTLARSVVAHMELRSHIRRMEERETLVNQTLINHAQERADGRAYFAKMCHELRTPVAGILGALSTLPLAGLTEQQVSHLDMATQASESLLNLVNNILDLSALESRRMSVERIPFDLQATSLRTLNLFSTAAREKNVELILGGGLGEEHWVSGDPTRIAQALTNLVGNAVKFTTRGHVKLNLNRRDAEVEITVEDTGAGIPPEIIARIFEPYAQADASIQRRFGGTGLGLTITREIAELLGGELDCWSTVGQGSVFRVRIPLPAVSAPSAKPVPGLRVLVVDDVTLNQKVVRAILTPHRAVVDLAASGEAALEVFRQNTYDLVLMDRYMPGLDGFATTLAMRRLETDLKRPRTLILGASAANEDQDNQKFIAAGADDVVAKPLRIEEFWLKVNRFRAAKSRPAA